jgi:hypothetical protein
MIRLAAVAIGVAVVCWGGNVPANPTLDDGYQQMYNLQFEDAHQIFQRYEKSHPADPLGPVSDAAAYLFSEFDRLHVLQSEFFSDDENFAKKNKLVPDPQLQRSFEAALDQARRLEPAGSTDSNIQFATVLTYGLRSDYLALVEKKYIPALTETKQARQTAEHLLMEQPDYYDAYLAIGVENYLLSLKSAPLRWVLRATGAQTDKQAGIDKLRLTATKGHYLQPFARLLLAVAALRDKDRPQARQYLAGLVAQFPANRLFREELAKVK